MEEGVLVFVLSKKCWVFCGGGVENLHTLKTRLFVVVGAGERERWY
jgi:hypothetical protein